MENKKVIYVIDGNSLLFRAYYATAYGENPSIMRTKDGTPTNAIFAFSNMLSKILSSFKGGESLFVAFDSDKDTFRKEEFADYKANRKPCPVDLIKQFPISRELLSSLGIMHYEEHGLEADDIAGTVASLASKEGYKVIVYTSDKDYLQLIDNNVTIELLKVGLSNMEEMNEATMKEKLGLTPKQIIDYKGLRGDASDNLPGIPGVGDKTATKLIQEYGSFDKIIIAAQSMKSKVGQNIVKYAEQGRQCYKLATMKTDVKLPFGLADLLYGGYEFSLANAFAQKYELRQFISRLPQALKSGPAAIETPAEEISSFKDVKVPNLIGLSMDVDFDEYHDAPVYGLAIATGERTCYISIENAKKDADLQVILTNPSIKKIVFDCKGTIYSLARHDLRIEGVTDDVLLAAYLLDSSVSPNEKLVFSSFGIDIEASEETMDLLQTGNVAKTSKIASSALSLKDKIRQNLSSVDAYKLYSEVELPLSKVLAKMELEGFPLHKEVLNEYGDDFKKKRDALQSEVYRMAGFEFNLNSPKQVADAFFNKLGIYNPRGGSTSVEALEIIKDEAPIVGKFLEYRKYQKLISTYIEGLLPHLKSDGKIHSYFNQAETSTGRLSSSSPNLQNISARDEEGKLIRKAFYYDDPDISLLSLDYGQIELRILAALSGCKEYIDVFNSDRDVHTETAKKIFHTDEITPLERRRAKAVNFAIIYGTTVYGLSEQIGGTPKEAEGIIRNFYLTYPEVGTFLNQIGKDAETKGYVTTMLGRRRYLRDLNDPNYAKREAAKRAALNAPIQGSAADLIKIAMVKIDAFLKEGHYETKMVLQIHDELIFKCPSKELAMMKEKLALIMTTAVTLPVKLVTEAGVGRTWYDAKD